MSHAKNIEALNANEQTPIDGGAGEGHFESGEEFTLPGCDRSKGEFVFGSLSGIDRDSELWKNAPEDSKRWVEDNDRSVRQRMDLEKSNEGRLQLFLQDFQFRRAMFTKNGSIDPTRWRIEESCMEWWHQAGLLRNMFGFNVLSPLPNLPENFHNTAQVQNALNALDAWAQESLMRLGTAKPSAKPNPRRSDAKNVLYKFIRSLTLGGVSKIVKFSESPDGKDLREMIDQELERHPTTQRKTPRKRTPTDVVEAALKSTYPSQRT